MRTIANNADGSIIIEAKIDRSQIPEEFAQLQKAMQKELENLQKTVDGLATNFEGLNKAAKDIETGLDGVKKGVEGVGEGFKQSEEKASGFRQKTTDAVTQVAQTMQAMRLQELVGAIADAFAECAQASIGFESAMTGVFKTINGTDEQLGTIEQGIRDMATDLPSTTTEIAGVAEAAGQLGVATEGILDFTEVMINLGEATNLTADEAASSLAKFANVTGMLEADYSRLGSVVVALGNTMATTEADIVAMGTRIASAGTQIGLTEDQIMGMAAALSSVGLEAEAGGTAISKLMIDMKSSASMAGETAEILSKTGMSVRELELLADTSASEFKALANELGYTSTELKNLVTQRKQLEKFAEIAGMTAEQFVDAFGKDAAKTMATFFEGLGNGSEDAITILNELGVTEVRLRDTMLRLTSASDLFGQAQSTAASAWEDNIALAEEAAKRYETTESKIAMLGNAFNDLKVSIGDVFSDSINDATGWLTDFTLAASEFVQNNPEVVKALGLVAGAIAGVGIAASAAMAISALVSAFSGMGAVIGIISAAGAAIGAFVTAIAIGDEVESVRELTTALREAKDGFKDADKVFETSMSNIKATSDVAGRYVEKLEALEEAGLGNAEAQAEYAQTVAKLNQLMPELNLTIDETTGKIQGGTEAIRDQIDAWKEAAEAQAYYQMYQQKVSLKLDAELEVTSNQNKLAEVQAELDKLISQNPALAFDNPKPFNLNLTGVVSGEQDKQAENYKLQIEELQAAISQGEAAVAGFEAELATLESSMTGTQEMTESVSTELFSSSAEMHGALAEMVPTTTQLGVAMSETASSAEELNTAVGDSTAFDNAISAIENLAEAYETELASAVETVENRFSLLSELPKKLETSFDEITKNLEEQKKYWDEYAAGLEKLKQAGLSEDVMAELSSGSDEAIGTVAALVEEIESLGGIDSAEVKTKIGEINTAFEDLKTSEGTVAGVMAAIKTQFDSSLAEIIESTGIIGKDTGLVLVTAIKNGVMANSGTLSGGAAAAIRVAVNQATADTSTDSQALGKAIVDGVCVGLEAAQGSLTNAATILGESLISALKAAVDSHSPSKRARDEVGITIPQGVAVGIEAGTGDVIKAGNKLAKESMKSLSEAFDKEFEDVRDTISSKFSLLSEIPERAADDTKASFESILSNLKDQTTHWDNYKKGLEQLKAAGLEAEIMDKLSDASEKSVNTVADLVAEIQELGGETSEAVKKMVSDINTAYAQNENAIDSVSATVASIRTGVTEEVAQLQKDLNITSKSSGEMIADAMKETIEANAPKVDEAAVMVFKTALEEAEKEIKNEEMFKQLAEVFGSDAEELTKAIEQVYDSFSEFGKELVWAFIDAFTEQLPAFQEAVITFFAALQLTISQKLVENTYKITEDMEKAMDVFFPYLFTSVRAILEEGPKLIQDLTTTTKDIVVAAVDMMTAAVQPLYENDDMLFEAGEHMAEAIIKGFKENGDLMAEFINWIIQIWVGELGSEKNRGLFSEAVGMMLGQTNSIIEANKDDLMAGGQMITESISEGVIAGLEEDDGVTNAFKDVMEDLTTHAKGALEDQKSAFEELGSSTAEAFSTSLTSSTENIDAAGIIAGMLTQLTAAASKGGSEAGAAWASAFAAAASSAISSAQQTVAGGAASGGTNVTNNNNTNVTSNTTINTTSSSPAEIRAIAEMSERDAARKALM